MAKCGLIKYDDFTERELNSLIDKYFPFEMDVSVPIGKAKLKCVSATVKLSQASGKLGLILLNDFTVEVMGNPVYRAHITARVSTKPEYKKANARIEFNDIRLDQLELIEDEYTLVKDTSSILEQLSPVSVTSALASPFKRALNAVTGGMSESAFTYLQSFTTQNKQRILSNHQSAIEQALLTEIHARDISVNMDPTHWREYLFSRIGTHISVEDQRLRFWIS